MQKKSFCFAIAVLAILFTFSVPAWAGSVSNNMTITVNYTPSCEISLNNVDLGTTNAIMNTDGIVSGSVNIDVTCSNGVPYAAKIVLAGDSVDMTNTNSKKLQLTFHDNNSSTGGQYTTSSNQIGGGKIGNGEKQPITNVVYARVRPNQTDCTSSGSNWLCDPGVYTANATFRVSF